MKNKLKTKRVFLYVMYNNLRNVAPKDYPTTDEIKNTINIILPTIKEHISVYLEMGEKAQATSSELIAGTIKEDVSKVRMTELNKKWAEYNKKEGTDLIEVDFGVDGFKTLKEQFDRDGWGKQWVSNIEEFGELMEAFEAGGKD